MLNLDGVRPAAKAAFEKFLTEKVVWISTKCWGINLKSTIDELNEIIGAGMKLGVAENCRRLTEQELAEVFETVHPLKTLKMEAEIQRVLRSVLIEVGVNPELFTSK